MSVLPCIYQTFRIILIKSINVQKEKTIFFCTFFSFPQLSQFILWNLSPTCLVYLTLPHKKKKKNVVTLFTLKMHQTSGQFNHPSLFPSIFNTVFLIRFISKDGVELEKTLSKDRLLSLANLCSISKGSITTKDVVVLF